MEYPLVDTELSERLARIPASFDGVCEYRPCRVHLKSGEVRDFVYLVEAECYISAWGIWPEEDDAKGYVPIGQVVEVEESPHRLPAELANKVYEAGESGMGYTVFTVVLRDGRRLPYVTGNAVDFPALPAHVTSEDIVDVLPHEDGEVFRHRMPQASERHAPYTWCLYRAR